MRGRRWGAWGGLRPRAGSAPWLHQQPENTQVTGEPLYDIRLLRGCCARINHPFIPSPTCIVHPGAIPLHDHRTVYKSPSDLPFVGATPYNIGNNKSMLRPSSMSQLYAYLLNTQSEENNTVVISSLQHRSNMSESCAYVLDTRSEEDNTVVYS